VTVTVELETPLAVTAVGLALTDDCDGSVFPVCTANEAEVPVMPVLSVAVSVVVWASTRVMPTVATPETNVTGLK
jgi:hypothetical protein